MKQKNCQLLSRLVLIAIGVCAQFLAATAYAAEKSAPVKGEKIHFKKHQLDTKFRSEGVAVGDFNGDGKLDIAAGSVYYAAPDWKMVSILDKPKEYDPHGYADSFQNFAMDVNGDGRMDLVVVDFPGKQTFWFEQPAKPGEPWKKHEATPITNNESPALLDVEGNGKRVLLMSFDPGQYVGYARPNADSLWKLVPISAAGAPGTDKYSHGIGIGDVNGDGRPDILIAQGWWEAPADRASVPWKFHPAAFGEKGERAAQIHVYDFNGDGRNDVLASSPHGKGIWWHEQTADGGWKTHEIDASFSQTHSLEMADINGDGLPDFVTGKRWWAHGPKGDVEADQPAVLYWYELTRKDGNPVWIPHEIDHDSGVGTQFQVIDVNGDGLLDIVVSNKKGVFYFEQTRE